MSFTQAAGLWDKRSGWKWKSETYLEKQYRGNAMNYTVKTEDNVLCLQSDKNNLYQEGEEITFSLQNARVLKSNC